MGPVGTPVDKVHCQQQRGGEVNQKKRNSAKLVFCNPSRVANLLDFPPKNANLGIFWPLGN
jgi:hypothetical protein